MTTAPSNGLHVETKLLTLGALVANEKNPNVMPKDLYAKMRENIRRTKLYPAIIVSPKGRGKFLILDGHHRVSALKELGFDEVQCEVWPLNEHEQNIALATLNRLRGEDDATKRRALLDELVSAASVAEIADMVPESMADINALLNPPSEGPAGEEDPKPRTSIKITADQWVVISNAVAVVRKEENDAKMAEGRALELICAEYLSSH